MSIKIDTTTANDGGVTSAPVTTNLADFSLIGRAKFNGLVNYRILFYNGNSAANGMGLLKGAVGVQTLLGGVAFGPAGSVSDDTWFSFVFQRTSGVSTLYIDGVGTGSTGASPGVPGTATFAARDTAGGAGMSVADLAVVQGFVLPTSWIEAHAKGVIVPALGIPSASLLAWWPCTGLDTSQDVDMSGNNGETLTWTNAALDTTTKPAPAMGRIRPFPSYGSTAVIPVPVNTDPPVITGTPALLQTLMSTTGTWTGSPSSYSYEWQESADGMSGWTPIGGATSSTFLLADIALVGQYLRCVVTAENGGGSGIPEPSNVLGPVAEYPTVSSFSVIS